MAELSGLVGLVDDRRMTGDPVYYISLGHIFSNTGLTFEQGKLQACWTLRNSDWLRDTPDSDVVHQMVDDLASTTTPGEFALQFETIRDQADYLRVWIDLIAA